MGKATHNPLYAWKVLPFHINQASLLNLNKFKLKNVQFLIYILPPSYTPPLENVPESGASHHRPLQTSIIDTNEVHHILKKSNVHVGYPIPQSDTKNPRFAYHMENTQDRHPINDTNTLQDWHPPASNEDDEPKGKYHILEKG